MDDLALIAEAAGLIWAARNFTKLGFRTAHQPRVNADKFPEQITVNLERRTMRLPGRFAAQHCGNVLGSWEIRDFKRTTVPRHSVTAGPSDECVFPSLIDDGDRLFDAEIARIQPQPNAVEVTEHPFGQIGPLRCHLLLPASVAREHDIN